MNQKFKNRKHKISFKVSARGLVLAFKTQPNFKVMSVFTVLVVLFGFLFNISCVDWMFLVMAIFLVYICEMINTSIEAMVDLITTEWREDAKMAKDIGSGMVLVSVMLSVAIGFLVFLPKALELL